MKLQTIHLQSLFQRQELLLLNPQPDEDNESIIPINAPEGSLPNKLYFDWDDACIASDNASVAESYNPDEPDFEHFCENKQIWECQCGHLHMVYKFTFT